MVFVPSVMTTAGPMIYGALERELGKTPDRTLLQETISNKCRAVFHEVMGIYQTSRLI